MSTETRAALFDNAPGNDYREAWRIASESADRFRDVICQAPGSRKRSRSPSCESVLDAAAIAQVLDEVYEERARQDAKWGEQNHPDGTGRAPHAESWGLVAGSPATIRDRLTKRCEARFNMGVGSWLDILAEEVAEAFAEDDPARLREELIQVAAVAVSWVQAIDRRAEP